MRRILALGFLLIILLCGCAHAAVCAEDLGEDHFSAVCELYSGSRSCQLTVGENACVSIRCNLTCRDGRLDLRITADDGSEAYRGDGLDADAAFVVQLTKPGTYTLYMESHSFTGSLRFDWETAGAVVR